MDRGPLFKPACAALALLCGLQLLALLRAPAAWMPASITVQLARNAEITLGRAELAAPDAAAGQLELRRGADGNWRLASANATAIALRHGDAETRTGTIALAAGQTFMLAAVRFAVDRVGARELRFHTGATRWMFDGATLYRDGAAQGPCPGARLPERAVALWNRVAPMALAVRRPVSLGGNLACGNRIGVPYAEPSSASIALTDGAMVLSGASMSDPLMLVNGERAQPLALRELALIDGSALSIGRTRFMVSLLGDRAMLAPAGNVRLFADPRIGLPSGVSWQWQKRAMWSLPQGAAWRVAAALAMGCALAAAIAFQRGRWPFVREADAATRRAAAATALLAIAGVAALLLQRSGTPPGPAVSALLGAAALWCCLLLPQRLSPVLACGVLLLAAGLLSQLEQGLGAPASAWLRYYQKSAALIAIGLGVGGQLLLRTRARSAPLPPSMVEWPLAALAVVALAGLGLQVVFGDETGVFDLQPVEFAKLALTALTAHCLAVGMGWHEETADFSHRGLRWVRLAAPVLVFSALLAFALVQVDDYSPLILLLVWSMSMAFAYALAARRPALALAIALCVCAAGAAVAALRTGGADAVSHWSFYGDRFLVWLDPLRHPHTGEQVLLGARAIADGAWFGADSLLGLGTLGQAAGSVLHIPAVQDDFAPAFFLNRHGLAAALLLWCLQAAFLASLVQVAAACFAHGTRTRDFRRAWLARLRCFALCGGAAFVSGHLLLSWGTNLAIFPVMGQPMSFLSAGGSHLLFFICPLLVFGAMSTQPFEENASCQSMSNVKC